MPFSDQRWSAARITLARARGHSRRPVLQPSDPPRRRAVRIGSHLLLSGSGMVIHCLQCHNIMGMACFGDRRRARPCIRIVVCQAPDPDQRAALQLFRGSGRDAARARARAAQPGTAQLNPMRCTSTNPARWAWYRKANPVRRRCRSLRSPPRRPAGDPLRDDRARPRNQAKVTVKGSGNERACGDFKAPWPRSVGRLESSAASRHSARGRTVAEGAPLPEECRPRRGAAADMAAGNRRGSRREADRW